MNESKERKSPRVTLPIEIFEALLEIGLRFNPKITAQNLIIQACMEYLERRNGFLSNSLGVLNNPMEMRVSIPTPPASLIDANVVKPSAFVEFEGFLDE